MSGEIKHKRCKAPVGFDPYICNHCILYRNLIILCKFFEQKFRLLTLNGKMEVSDGLKSKMLKVPATMTLLIAYAFALFLISQRVQRKSFRMISDADCKSETATR